MLDITKALDDLFIKDKSVVIDISQKELSDIELLKVENKRLKQNIINLKYKWSKLFAAKRYRVNKKWIRIYIAEQAELLTDIEQTLSTK